MGGGSSIVYSVEVPGQAQQANCTTVRRAPECVHGLLSSTSEQIRTMQDRLGESMIRNSNGNCLGTIVQSPDSTVEAPKKMLSYLTYDQVLKNSKAVGSAILQLGLAPYTEEVPGQKMRFVGVYAKNRAEWIILDLACVFYGFVTVPLYDTLGPDNIPYVLNHSGVTNMFCSAAAMESLSKCNNFGKLKSIICFDPIPQAAAGIFTSKGIKSYSFSQLMTHGSSHLHEFTPVKPADCLTFCYTSGTTGPPKGAMLSHANYLAGCTCLEVKQDVLPTSSDVYLSYLPLPHVMQRLIIYTLLASGTTICFYSGDVQKIKEDLEVVKPTIFLSVPRLYSRLYDGVSQKFNEATGCQKTIVDRALSTKLDNVTTDGSVTHCVYDRLVFNKTRNALGGRIRVMFSGSAPLLPHIHSFMKVIGCCPLMEGYGQTESTGASFATKASDPTVGHVGGPTSMTEFKLQDIPEMHYTHNDRDEHGRPAPRGQVCIRGPGVFMGYYKDPEKTKQAVDKDGWLHTGDVGIILPSNGALKLIDRKKNIFKLQQGEYVASEKVQDVYFLRPEISQMFIYGDSTETYAVAVIVPKKAAIEDMGKQLGLNLPFEQLCKNQQLRKHFVTILNDHGKKKGLQSFEQAKNIYLEPQPFLNKNILTNTMKLQRHAAKKAFAQEIAAMYKEGMLTGKEK